MSNSDKDEVDLKAYSILTYCLERIFRLLQMLSLAHWIIGVRTSVGYPNLSVAERKLRSRRRGAKIEAYLCLWFILEALCAIAIICHGDSRIAVAGVVIMFYRVADIAQAAVNINIFDPFRTRGKPTYVLALVRALLISCLNFIEIGLCFGAIYAAHLKELKGADSWRAAYFFSFVTQLTVGYGDILPEGMMRFIAVVQALLGFFFGLIILSRFVSALPRLDTLLEDEKQP